MKSFAEKVQIVNLRAPAAADNSFKTAHIRMRNVQWLSFLVQWGETAGLSTSLKTYQVRSAATQSTGASDTLIPFKYRLAEAVGGDTWGAVTAAVATAGAVMNESMANRTLLIEVDPADIPGLHSDGRYAYLQCTASGTSATDANYALGVVALLAPRYPQNANLEST